MVKKHLFLCSEVKHICKYYMAWKGMRLQIKSTFAVQLQFIPSEYNAEDSCIKIYPTLQWFTNIPAEDINYKEEKTSIIRKPVYIDSLLSLFFL